MVRQLAWEVLRSGNPAPMREVDVAADEVGLDARDRGLLRRIVGAEVRHRGTLRALVDKFARGNPKVGLRTHLHVGMAQLFWCDRVPPRAALSEVVDATRRTLGPSKTAYVNGVLRAVLRARIPGHCGDPRRDLADSPWHFEEPIFADPAEHPYLWMEAALSIPSMLAKRWGKRFGDERAFALGRYFQTEPPLSLRIVQGEPEAVKDELLAHVAAFTSDAGSSGEDADPAVELRASAHPRIWIASGDIGHLLEAPAFHEGRVTVQGEAALRAAELCAAVEGEEWLDLCAAPGGKTAVLAGAGANVTAIDVSEAKLARLTATLDRLGLASRVTCVESDGTAALGERNFDGVLIDAPCSNTGVLGARPGARWRFGKQTQRELTELQYRLLVEGAARVRPGGRLVWSTCSLEGDENSQLVRRFLGEHAGWEQDAALEHLPGLPSQQDGEAPPPTDGGTATRLKRLS